MKYYIGESGVLTGYGPYEVQQDAYYMRQVILATGGEFDSVIIVRASGEDEARERIQTWHAQCEAAKATEEGTS